MQNRESRQSYFATFHALPAPEMPGKTKLQIKIMSSCSQNATLQTGSLLTMLLWKGAGMLTCSIQSTVQSIFLSQGHTHTPSSQTDSKVSASAVPMQAKGAMVYVVGEPSPDICEASHSSDLAHCHQNKTPHPSNNTPEAGCGSWGKDQQFYSVIKTDLQN